MMKFGKMLVVLGCLLPMSGISVISQAKSVYKPKPFVTPWEYYGQARPAVLQPEDSVKVKKAEYQDMDTDTRSDKRRTILIGTLVGVSVIGGTVAGIMLAK